MPGERGPLHRVIADRLRERITSGQYRPGQPFRSVQQVVDEWGCTERTARTALGHLQREGLLVIQHGQMPRVAVDQREELAISARRIRISARPATEDEAAACGITEGSPVLVEIDDQRRELRVWPAALTILDITDQ